jgi:hypothetical protein
MVLLRQCASPNGHHREGVDGNGGDPAAGASPYLLELGLVDFILFSGMKKALAGIMLGQESLKNAWEGVTRSITT